MTSYWQSSLRKSCLTRKQNNRESLKKIRSIVKDGAQFEKNLLGWTFVGSSVIQF